jgi:hypothetical protein
VRLRTGGGAFDNVRQSEGAAAKAEIRSLSIYGAAMLFALRRLGAFDLWIGPASLFYAAFM